MDSFGRRGHTQPPRPSAFDFFRRPARSSGGGGLARAAFRGLRHWRPFNRLECARASEASWPGPGAAVGRSLATATGVRPARAVVGEAALPSARRVGRLARAALGRGEGQPVEALTARYLRRAEAEATRLASPVESGAVARVDTSAR